MNLWHDITLGDKAPEEINVIIETPKGSLNKYEIDKKMGIIRLDRANYSAAAFPCEYGFAPQTLWDDGDAIDVIVLATFPIPTGIMVTVRPVALMEMIDTGESDYKIIGVPVHDRRLEDIYDLDDLNKHNLKEIQHFFETYKDLKGKPGVVVINGFKGRKEALEAIKKSVEIYKKKFAK